MAKKKVKSWRYLFKLPVNFFNNKKVGYEISPLPYSDQEKVIVFAGKNDLTNGRSIVTYILSFLKS
jgi:hypothetical protein